MKRARTNRSFGDLTNVSASGPITTAVTPLSVPAEIGGEVFSTDISLLGDVFSAGFEINSAFDKLAIDEGNFTIEYDKATIEGFEYNLPIALAIANKIAADPLDAFNAFSNWVQGWISVFNQPTYDFTQQGFLNLPQMNTLADPTTSLSHPFPNPTNVPFNLTDLSGNLISTLITENLPNLPNGCNTQTSVFNYFVSMCGNSSMPLTLMSMVTALCTTDNQAFNSLCSIVFSSQMLDLLNDLQPVLNQLYQISLTEGWPDPTGNQSHITEWFWNLFCPIVFGWCGGGPSYQGLIGPGFLLPQSAASPSTISPAYGVFLGYLQNATGLQAYLRANSGVNSVNQTGFDYATTAYTSPNGTTPAMWSGAQPITPPVLPQLTLGQANQEPGFNTNNEILQQYLTQLGDTLQSVAGTYGVTVDQLANLNPDAPLVSDQLIQTMNPDQTLPQTYTTVLGDTIFSVFNSLLIAAPSIPVIDVNAGAELLPGWQLIVPVQASVVAQQISAQAATLAEVQNSYTSASGDTLASIAAANGVTVAQLEALNPALNVVPGSVITGTDGTTYDAAIGDTTESIASQYQAAAPILVGQTIFIPPTTSQLSTATTQTLSTLPTEESTLVESALNPTASQAAASTQAASLPFGLTPQTLGIAAAVALVAFVGLRK